MRSCECVGSDILTAKTDMNSMQNSEVLTEQVQDNAQPVMPFMVLESTPVDNRISTDVSFKTRCNIGNHTEYDD